MLEAKEIDRLNSLYEQAVKRYLDKTDFNPSDWLPVGEDEEYADLVKKDEEDQEKETT